MRKIEENKSILFNLPALSPKCTEFFSAHWMCSSNWILYLHSTDTTHGYDTNNYCEASVRLMKESIVHRTKAILLGQLLRKLTEDHDTYYIMNRLLNSSHSRYL
jgi:hypothetical protein